VAPEPQPVPTLRPFLLRHQPATLWTLAILVISGEAIAWAGYFSTARTDSDLAKTFAGAAVTLFFGALLGAVIQVLFADLELQRTIRAADADFIGNILADLKTVYDRVDRAMTLIGAHRSAKTYGEEVRDLIEYRVKLHNVIRAIEFDPRARNLDSIKADVEKMRSYVDELVGQFQDDYKSISDAQRIHEARVKNALEKTGDYELAQKLLAENNPWRSISQLEIIKDRIDPPGHDPSLSAFRKRFVAPLNEASRKLREQLHSSLR
jgi:hypothetical protein